LFIVILLFLFFYVLVSLFRFYILIYYYPFASCEGDLRDEQWSRTGTETLFHLSLETSIFNLRFMHPLRCRVAVWSCK